MNAILGAVKNTIAKGNDLIRREQTSIGRATLEMIFLMVITKILGMLKMAMMAGRFGASRELDIFYLANTIPELIFNIIAVGSINAALIPIYTKCRAEDGEAPLIDLFRLVLKVMVIIFVVISIVMFILAPQIINLSLKVNIGGVDSAFSESDIILATTMMRVMLIAPVVLGVSSIISSYLLVHQRYIASRLAPLLYNVGAILGVIVLVPLFNGSVLGLALGSVLAAVLHMVSQLPALYHLIDMKKVKEAFNVKKYIGPIFKLAMPRALTVAAGQFSTLFKNVIALNLVPGSLASYQFATTIYSIAVDLFGTTTAEAFFPRLSRLGAEGKSVEQAALFNKGIQRLLFMTIPMAIMIMVLRVPIVRLVFGIIGSGFTWEDTVMTSWILFFLSFLVVLESLNTFVLRGFYSMRNTLTPLVVNLLALVGNLALSVLLVTFFSNINTFSLLQPYSLLGWDKIKQYFLVPGGSPVAIGGLAAAAVIAWGLEGVILLVVLNKKMHFITKVRLVQYFKKLVSGIVMGIGLYSSFRIFDSYLDTTRVVPLIIVLCISSVLGGVLYLLTEYVLEDDELSTIVFLWNGVKLRLGRLFKKPQANTASPVVPIES